MANLFKTARNIAFFSILIASGVVLGLGANFANRFLPHIHRPYTVFSVIVPAVTIVVLIILLLRSQPRIEVFALFVLVVLWLTLAAWSQDVIGFVECFPLGGQQTPTKNGEMSLQQYCYEMKSIEAFSWAVFAILLICFILLIALVTRVTARGRHRAWEESISDLPWFGQWNVPYGNYGSPQPMYPGGGPQPQYPGGYGGQQPYVVQQTPGHSLVIQPSANGGPPMVTQVQGNVNSVV